MFLEEVKDRLVEEGVGIYGTNIFIGSKSIIPALGSTTDLTRGAGPYLSIISTGGSGANRTQNGFSTENPSAQLSCRASTMAGAMTMLQAAYDALGGADGLTNIDLTGVRYLSLIPVQPINDIGLDDAGRAMVAFNIRAEKKPS